MELHAPQRLLVVAQALDCGLAKATRQYTQVGATASAGAVVPLGGCWSAHSGGAYRLPPAPSTGPAAARSVGRQCRVRGADQVCHSRGTGTAGSRHAAGSTQRLPSPRSSRGTAQVGARRSVGQAQAGGALFSFSPAVQGNGRKACTRKPSGHPCPSPCTQNCLCGCCPLRVAPALR